MSPKRRCIKLRSHHPLTKVRFYPTEPHSYVYYIDHDGYIDHQSCEDYGSLQEFLDSNNVGVIEFVFNSSLILEISNDNM